MQPDYFEDGRQAFLDGLPLSAVPAELKDDDAAEWEGGWMCAEEEGAEDE